MSSGIVFMAVLSLTLTSFITCAEIAVQDTQQLQYTPAQTPHNNY